jgi:hypothetical protein
VHDNLSGFVANEHIDWTASSAGTIHASNYTDTTTNTMGSGFTVSATTDTTPTTITQADDLFFAAGAGITCETTADGTVTISSTVTDTNTTYSAATSSALGLMKLEDDTEQTTAANAVSTTAGRTYGVQFNSSDQAVVNVPWTDTDTDTNTMGSGFTVSATTDTTPTTITETDDLFFAAGTGITCETTADGTVTITNTVANTDTQLTEDQVDDYVAGLLTAGSNVSLTYDDTAGTLTIASTYTDTNTTYTGGTNLTLAGTAFNVDDAFLKNDASDVTTGTITAGGFTTAGTLTVDSIGISTIQSSAESFADNDTSLMTSAAIADKIEAYGYGTSSGDMTGVDLTAGAGITIDSETNTASGDYSATITCTVTDTNTQLSQEQVEDFVGGMLGGTETLITVTYQDGTGDIDFVVDNNLANYDNSSSGFITATLTEEQVEDFVGGMLGGTETGITVTYQDATHDIDFVVADTTVAGDSGSTAMTPGDTLTIAGGTNVTTAMSGDTLTITSTDTTYVSSDFTHDSLTGFVANEHIDWTGSSAGTIHLTNLPATALTSVQTAVSQAAMLALTTEEGDVVVRSDEGKTYMHHGGVAATMADFTLLATPTDAVTSVDGATGVITLNHDTLTGFVANEHLDWTANVGTIHAGNYTNTTYSVGDGGLTEINFTSADNTKLDGIAASANNYSHTTNANLTGDVTSIGNATTIATDAVDIAMLSAAGTASSSTFLRGDNTWVTPTNTTYSEATTSAEGLMSTAHHDKLDGIEASADVTDATNVTAAGALMDSELAGIEAVKATTGTFLTADQTKLDGIAASANNYTLPSASVTVVGGVELATTGETTTGTDTARAVTPAGVQAAIDALIGGAPGALDTLNELAAAINDDASYASTITTALGLKAPIASPTFTGTVAIPNVANLETAVVANTAKVTNVSTNLATTTSTTTAIITSSDGTDATIPVATTSVGGVMSKALFDKLDGIEASATADQSNAEIAAAVEAASDSNTFTDADHSKLNAIEASADVTDTTNVTAAGALMDSELTDLAGVKGVTISTLQVKPSEGAFANGDKTKLDAIEASADVTDATNVTAAGALMDSEVANLAFVKALAKGISDGNVLTANDAVADDDFLRINGTEVEGLTVAEVLTALNVEAAADVTDTANVTSAGALMDSELTDLAGVKGVTISTLQVKPSEGAFANGDKTKLDAIEASADVTDATNVTAAGALMDSEVTNLATVKALATGISNGNFLIANAAVADNDFLRIDGTAVEGRTASEVLSDIAAAPAAGNSSILTVGTIGTGTWQGTAIATAYIADDAITGAKIALFDDSLAATTTHFLIADGTDYSSFALSGDVTCTNAGVVSIADDVISSAELADACTAVTSFTAPLIEGSTSVQTPLIEYTDGDDAITIADGGLCTFPQLTTFSKAIKPGLKADTDGATVTFDLNEPNMHTVTLGGNRTFAISNETAGQRFIIRILQDGTGSRLVSTWFSTIKWAGGSAPTLTTTANKADVFGFIVTGTDTYDGFIVGQNV